MTLEPTDRAAETTPGETPTGDTCASERRAAEEACAVADRLRALLDVARAELRDTQRSLAMHEEQHDRAIRASDHREIRRRKDDAFAAFRAGRAHATGPGDLEVAARAWLHEIDEANTAMLAARRVIGAERAEIGRMAVALERRSIAVDRARVAAERATEACRAARERLAACEEIGMGGAARPLLAGSHERTAAEAGPGGTPATADGTMRATDATIGIGRPRILAILAGDAAARDAVAASLGADDPDAMRRWAEDVDGLASAIIERALEEARFVFPADHPFWGIFTAAECREIAVALGALGHHPIPGAGWADDRVPSRRDLSLAVGFAGADPMRVRIWPNEEEMARLFDGTETNVYGFLLEQAGGLTLGEMVALLGRRAEVFTDLWNAWGRVRPLLLAETD